MKSKLIKKGLILVIIFLFVSVILTPGIAGENKINDSISADSDNKEIIKTDDINNGTLSGYVTDTFMNPIEGVRVRVHFHGTYEENYTDSTGYYHVTNIPLCWCVKNATASKQGYITEWVLLIINETTTHDFVLKPVGSFSYPVDIISEGFEGTWTDDGECNVPVDPVWGLWDIDSIYWWSRSGYPQLGAYIHQMVDYGGYGLPYNGTYCAGAWWCDMFAQDEWLITPELDLWNFTDLELSFYGIWNWESTYNDHVYIKVSTDGGNTWDILADLLEDPEYEVGAGGPAGYGWCWNEYQVVLDLSAYDKYPSVLIAYQLLGDPTMGAINFIDDFKLTGKTANLEADFFYTPNTADAQEEIHFYDVSKNVYGQNIVWDWDFGDGYTSSMKNSTHIYNNNGFYNVTLTIYDNNGEINDSITKSVLVGGLYISNLEEGWNLVSLPFNLSINKLDLFVQYNYDNCNWRQAINDHNPKGSPIINDFIFGWSRNGQQYSFIDILEPGYGYWIYAYDDCLLVVENSTITVDNYVTNIDAGWNIISVSYDQPVDKADLVVIYSGLDYTWSDAVNGGIINNYVFGWDSHTQSYTFSDMFQPGFAYWVYAYQPCTLKRS